MAEMVDASDLGSGFLGSGGSTPSMGILESWQNGYCTGLENQRPLDFWVRIPGSPLTIN